MKNCKPYALLIILTLLLTGAFSACSRTSATPMPTAQPTRDPKIEATAIA